MADINHIITLGIGIPGEISEFITAGLQIAIDEPENSHIITQGIGTPSGISSFLLLGLQIQIDVGVGGGAFWFGPF